MEQHLANLRHAASIAQEALNKQALPELSQVPEEVFQSVVYTASLATGLMLLLLPRTRKFIFETAEAILTIALLLVLMAVVLGMPVGVIYMSCRGVAFLYSSLLANFPSLQHLATFIHTQVTAAWTSIKQS